MLNLEADIFSSMEDSEKSKQQVVLITLFTTVQVLFQRLDGV